MTGSDRSVSDEATGLAKRTTGTSGPSRSLMTSMTRNSTTKDRAYGVKAGAPE